MINAQRLREIPQLENVPTEQLDWLIERSTIISLEDGASVFKKGDAIDNLYIILSGEIEFKVDQNGAYKTIANIGINGISGLLPYSRASTTLAYGYATESSEVLFFHREYFKELCTTCYELTEALVQEMTTRARDYARRNVQEEKMMALGKLSAGLAHELNNPAAAIVRSASVLKKHLSHVPEKFKRIIAIRASPQEIDAINKLVFDKIKTTKNETRSLIETSNAEDELEAWLEDQDIDNAYNLVEIFVDYGIQKQDLIELMATIESDNLSPALDWMENVLTTEKMVLEIDDAAQRISGLVKSVKTYTHMDSSQDKEAVDIHQSINNTLTMLNHKLKVKSIKVEKEFDDNLPKIPLRINEMNQVWTNLIDNAIDAVAEKGVVKVKTFQEKAKVFVEIQDNGSGIPSEVVSKIFDEFYTTKAIGKGTGMGLGVVQRILNQHNITIGVESKPGKTVFTLQIPLSV